MDLSRYLSFDLPAVALLQQPPDTLLAALVSSAATLALLAGFAPHLARGSAARPGREAETPAATSCDFLINGRSVKPLSEPGRALLDSLAGDGPPLAALKAHLVADCPGIHRDVEALVLDGTGFRRHCPRGDGTAIEICGTPRGDAAFLSIRAASEDARALQDARDALHRATGESRFLRQMLDRAPLLAWCLGPDDQVSWANQPYRERFDAAAGRGADHRIADVFGHVLEEVPLTARGDELRSRVSVAAPGDAEPRWYEVSRRTGESGETLAFALESDEIVAAEAALRRFVETLTETFAHLPIGLAVFDKNRRLGLFNPALTELVKIDAVWLAGRPSLRDFLERLRETRQMPEQKDFAAWRRKLGELEEGARDGTYEENWVLPSGKIFRVTGRPHPQGALAFLFEDISTSVMLERKYRSELELSQATLDRLSEAVAVFDASGTLVFVNTAFESMWGLNQMERLEGPSITEMNRIWAARCAPSPVWPRLAEFATAAEARTSWLAEVETRDGRPLDVLVAPLPDASALVVFRDRARPAAAPETASDAGLAELALEQIRTPAEAAIGQLMAAIPAARSPEAFKGLSAAAQGLKDGLARADELRRLAATRGAEPGPLQALSAALRARELKLALAGDGAAWDAAARRAAVALGLAAAERATPGATVTVTLDAAEGLRRLTVAAEVDAARKDGPGLGLAQRMVEAAGGSLEVSTRDGRLAYTAILPPLGGRSPAEDGAVALRA
jgi:PAS domain-containing protein